MQKQEASPLLRLPAELKLRIYELVLGGNVIHMNVVEPVILGHSRGGIDSRGPRRLIFTICQADATDAEAAAAWRGVKQEELASNVDPLGHEAGMTAVRYKSIARHRHCSRNNRPASAALRKSDLNILLACRTTYNEAALVPFEDNTFTFSCPRTLYELSTSLSAAQYNAISKMLCYGLNCAHRWRTFEFHTGMSQTLRPDLPDSLRHLTICVELSERNEGRGPHHWTLLRSETVRQMMFDGLAALTWRHEDVSVEAHILGSIFHRYCSMPINPTLAELSGWENEIKRRASKICTWAVGLSDGFQGENMSVLLAGRLSVECGKLN